MDTHGWKRRRIVTFIIAVLAVMGGVIGVGAQQERAKAGTSLTPVAASSGEGLEEVVWAIDKARVVTRILYVTAHPDDEPGALLTYLARGMNADVALLSITRGEGGQNALGPEQGAQLAALRSRELLEATRAYGTKLFFTRAEDRGFVKTVEETQRLWEGVALRDMVAVIRRFRPHIVINNWAGVRTGHGHHQTAGLLVPEAVKAAGDASAFPELAKEGLEAWEVGRVLTLVRGQGQAPANALRMEVGMVSPLLGRTYAEIGREGYSKHRTQGVAAFAASPFAARAISVVAADGKEMRVEELARPLGKLSISNGANLEATQRADELLGEARQAAMRLEWAAAVRALANAGTQTTAMRERLRGIVGEESARLGEEYAQTDERVDRALALAAGVRVEAQADRREVVAGEDFSVRVQAGCRTGVTCTLGEPELVMPEWWVVKKEGKGEEERLVVGVPKGATLLRSGEEHRSSGGQGGKWGWMLPRPGGPLVKARVRVTVEGDYSFAVEAPVMAQRATSTRVDTLPLELTPAVTLTVEPKSFVVLKNQAGKALEVVVRVRYRGTKPAVITAGLEVPAGWKTNGTSERRVGMSFAEAGDQLERFLVTPLRSGEERRSSGGQVPASNATSGTVTLRAWAKLGDETYRTSLEPLPMLPEKLWSEPAEAKVYVLDAAVPAGLRIGYVAAENDPVPEALRGLPVQLEMLDEKALAFGELGKFDAIVVGIRGYELRGDLIRTNGRLLKYVEDGGTVVVQYQRNEDWNRWRPGPYPATMGREREGQAQGPFRVDTLRTVDENSPVRVVDEANPLLNFPNKITAADFEGWVQERGLYYWGKWDERYRPVLALRDAGEEEMQGALVYARYGKGVYVYTGLAFFRELPAGVPGAWRLFVNLVSQGTAVR